MNCQAELIGRYCHVCGQENLEPKETVLHLVQHFFNDITHFDGKFFETVKYMMRKPGFLSLEYMKGRRATYLNPIRMYVFTSAIFFLILFAMKSPKEMVHYQESADKPEKGKTLTELKKALTAAQQERIDNPNDEDSNEVKQRIAKLDLEVTAIRKEYSDTTTHAFTRQEIGTLLVKQISDSLPETQNLLSDLPEKIRQKVLKNINKDAHTYTGKAADSISRISDDEDALSFFGMNEAGYRSVEAYDSTEQAYPDSLRDGWLKRTMMHKIIAANEEFRKNKREYFEHVAENILHSMPKVFFFSLPLFALILNILYFRRKKTYYYVDHGIFTIHLYCATFILTMAILLLYRLGVLIGLHWLQILFGVVIFALCVYITIYLYKAMRGFYLQGRFKTFLKYCIVCLLSFVVNMIIVTIFILLSVVSV